MVHEIGCGSIATAKLVQHGVAPEEVAKDVSGNAEACHGVQPPSTGCVLNKRSFDNDKGAHPAGTFFRRQNHAAEPLKVRDDLTTMPRW